MADSAQDQGDGQAREDDVGDRLAQRIGAAEVAAQRPRQPVEELDHDRPVEAVELADGFDVLGPGALAGDGNRRIAGDIDHGEGDEGDRQRHQHRQSQTLDCEGEHGGASD